MDCRDAAIALLHDKIERRIQGLFMSHPELLEQLRQLSRVEKFQLIQFLAIELAREEGLSLENEAEAIMAGVHTSNAGETQLMQLLEMEKEKVQNV